jgi:hypothetical protein
LSPQGQTTLPEVFAMLDACAKGHTRKLGRGGHTYRVMYRGKTFWQLPKGGHSGKDQVQLLKIAKMVRDLEIESACATREIPALQGFNLGEALS